MTTPQQAACYDDPQDPVGSAPKRQPGQTIALSVAAVFVVALSSVVALSPTASAGPTKVVVDGQDITGQSGGTAICDDQGEYHIQGHDMLIYAVLSSDRTQVQELDFMQAQLGKQWSYAQGHPGNAQVSQSGNTYTFTGDIAPQSGGSLVPFEADVTCS